MGFLDQRFGKRLAFADEAVRHVAKRSHVVDDFAPPAVGRLVDFATDDIFKVGFVFVAARRQAGVHEALIAQHGLTEGQVLAKVTSRFVDEIGPVGRHRYAARD